MQTRRKFFGTMIGMSAALVVALSGTAANAQTAAQPSTPSTQKVPEFKWGWSNYIGWCVIEAADKSGILARHAAANGVKVTTQRFDYVSSWGALPTGDIHALTITNLDGLVQATERNLVYVSVIYGDYSNGADRVITRGLRAVRQLDGVPIYGEDNTVSDFMAMRMGVLNGGIKINFAHRAEGSIVSAFRANASDRATATWMPLALELSNDEGNTVLFDSSQIPYEIQDHTMALDSTVRNHPEFIRAITGAWFETVQILRDGKNADGTITRDDLLGYMANAAGCTPEIAAEQLKFVYMYHNPADAAAFMRSAKNREVTQFVRDFCFDQALLGPNATDANFVGIEFPAEQVGGTPTVLGDKNNIRLRFDPTFMEAVAAQQAAKKQTSTAPATTTTAPNGRP